MRLTGILGVAVMLAAGAGAVCATELKSGIPVGGRMPRYMAVKCGGGNDGVKLGKSLCYT